MWVTLPLEGGRGELDHTQRGGEGNATTEAEAGALLNQNAGSPETGRGKEQLLP